MQQPGLQGVFNSVGEMKGGGGRYSMGDIMATAPAKRVFFKSLPFYWLTTRNDDT